MAWAGSTPPYRIETARLVLRAWELADTEAFGEMIASSRDHYAEFIPFFVEGEPLDRIRRYRAGFDSNESFGYGAFLAGRVVGGGGLFPRIGPRGLELGYQVRADSVGRGFATELAEALLHVAFVVCGADRVEVHIDPANRASVAVAERLGMPWEATLRRRLFDEGREPRDVAIYTLFRDDYRGEPALRAFDALGRQVV
jgi:RimJ/RimL family protein N-acetyltransferase